MSAPSRNRLFALIGMAGILLLFELGARAAIALIEPRSGLSFAPVSRRLDEQTGSLRQILASQGETLLSLDSELGWVYAGGRSTDLYTSNDQGLRARREYAARAPDGVLRVAAFGDSFVHGNEVGDTEVWSSRAEALDPRVEVLNYGVGGYGIDQALLLYERHRAELDPRVVVLGFTEVGYARNLNRYRRFLSPDELPLFKPRFRLGTDGSLELIPNPFPRRPDLEGLLEEPRRVVRAGRDDFFFEPLIWENPLYDLLGSVRLVSTIAPRAWRSRLRSDRLYRDGAMNPDSPGFPLLVSLVRRFHGGVRADGREFLFVVFPGRHEDIWGDGPRAYAPLLEALQGVPVLDLADALRADPALSPANLNAPRGHYGPEANLSVARAVLAELVPARRVRAPAESLRP